MSRLLRFFLNDARLLLLLLPAFEIYFERRKG